jgi:hypothetical protein
MLKLASFLIAAAALPALADAPAPASAPPKTIYNFAPPPTTCYFIRQANHQLRTPEDKPRFIRIAEIKILPLAAPSADCISDVRVIKTVIKTSVRE